MLLCWFVCAPALRLRRQFAVGLAVSLPLYADAVNYRVLQEQLNAEDNGSVTKRSPFAFMFMYMGGLNGALEWVDTEPLDDYIRNRASGDLGLPRKVGVRYFGSDKLSLYPNDPADRWYNGKSSAENRAEARDYLRHWMDLATTIGQGEYDCTHYLDMFLIPLSYLAEWSQDAQLKQRAAMMA